MKRILVVDDEEDICEILKFNLEFAGYEVDVYYPKPSNNEHLQLLVEQLKMNGITFLFIYYHC